MCQIDDLYIMKEFPDFHEPGFNIETYNEKFRKNNVIIHARSKDVSYPEHWGCLSVKCAFNGSEYYNSHHSFYAVNENNYLIFNEGKSYSSYIFSETIVESFTINFSSVFQNEILNGLFSSCDHQFDDFKSHLPTIEFIEKLYKHDRIVSPVLFRLYKLSSAAKPEFNLINEAYYELLEKLFLLQDYVSKEIQRVKAIKAATRTELYKRLHAAKDYIDSCYTSNITLDKLAAVSCLNSSYFLRQFKKYFHITPYQYNIQKRMELAKKLLITSDTSVTEVCFATGYEDVSSFVKLFKNHFHVSPEVYRKQHGKKSIFTC